MGHKGHMEGLLEQKDEKIKMLENRIQGYIGRFALLQSRLLATLDTLDVTQANQAEELSSSLRTQAKLRAQLEEYVKIVKAAEVERDDMRDAVLKLIEKVEASNDFSTWPHSQIRLTSLPDIVALPRHNAVQSTDEEELISFASSLIETLRRERDFERNAHAQTRKQAEARILALEAKVSRREAELEIYVVNAGHSLNNVEDEHDQPTPRPKSRQPALRLASKITNEQITSILDETVARNKRLEGEIATLYRRLEYARASKSESRLDNPASPMAISPTATRERKRQFKKVSHLNSDNLSITTSPLVSPEQPVSGVGEGSQVLDNVARVRGDPVDLNPMVLQNLEHQIKLLSDKIDAFADERAVILEALSVNLAMSDVNEARNEARPQSDTQLPTKQENNLELERHLRYLDDGYASLRESAVALRNELAATREGAQFRESELINVINELREVLFNRTITTRTDVPGQENQPVSSYQAENVPLPSNNHYPHASNDLNDNPHDHPDDDHADLNELNTDVLQRGDESDDGEISMELATPLLPISNIPASPTRSVVEIQSNGEPSARENPPMSAFGDSWAPEAVGDEDGHTHENDRLHAEGGGDSVNEEVEQETEYVDPPSIPLPPSPPELDERNDFEVDGHDDQDDGFDQADSPTLSFVAPLLPVQMEQMRSHPHTLAMYQVTSSFVAELRQVENEIAMSQTQLDEGVNALQRVEELVEELQPSS